MSEAPNPGVTGPPGQGLVAAIGPRLVLTAGVRAARAIVWGASGAVLVLVASSLLWGGGARDLLSPGVSMRPPAARIFGLLAISLLCLGARGPSGRRLRWGRAVACIGVAASACALLLHAGVGRSMVRAIAPDLLRQIDSLPTIPCAAGAMLGLALLCLHRGSYAAARLVVLLALASGFIGLLAVFGHVFDAPRLYFESGSASVAPMGAVSLLLLSIGVWCAQPDRGPVGLLIANDAGGASLRHLLPAVLVLLPALAWLWVSAERAGLFSIAAGGAVFAALVMVVLGSLLAIDAARLSRLDRRHRSTEQSLAALAADLERQVAARTRELSHGNAELQREVVERQRAEALFRGVFDGVPDAVLVIDPDGRVALANGRCAEILGYPREALLGQPAERLISPKITAAYRERWRDFRAEPQSYALLGEMGDVFLRRADGTDAQVEVALGSAVIDGRPWAIVSMRDISARLVAQRSAATANARYASLVNNLPVGVFVASAKPDGVLLEANPAMLRLMEADSMDALLSQPLASFHAVPDEHAAMLAAAARAGGLYAEQFEVATLRGRSFRGALTVASRYVDDELVWDGVLEDVTARTAAEKNIRDLNAALARRADELEVANRELETFSYSVSHDLRAPLRAIDGFSRIIEQQCADRLDEVNRGRLTRVRHNAQRMGNLIDDLLNLARVARAPLQWRSVDLSAMATEIIDGLRERDPARQVQVLIAPRLQARGDGHLLRVALENLLDNAWKFTQYTPAARIEFGIEHADSEPVFVVRDNGAGFDMAHAEQLFGPFQRLHGIDEFPGSGIGLATVHRIIHKHSGRIWAQAQPRRGACFHFTLPQKGAA